MHKTLLWPGCQCAASSTRRISYRRAFPGVQGGPLMHIIAAKAVCFKEAMEPSFLAYQNRFSRMLRHLPAR